MPARKSGRLIGALAQTASFCSQIPRTFPSYFTHSPSERSRQPARSPYEQRKARTPRKREPQKRARSIEDGFLWKRRAFPEAAPLFRAFKSRKEPKYPGFRLHPHSFFRSSPWGNRSPYREFERRVYSKELTFYCHESSSNCLTEISLGPSGAKDPILPSFEPRKEGKLGGTFRKMPLITRSRAHCPELKRPRPSVIPGQDRFEPADASQGPPPPRAWGPPLQSPSPPSFRQPPPLTHPNCGLTPRSCPR